MLIPVDGTLEFFRKVAEEHVGLALHRADAPHLEHQPLQYQRTPLRVRWHQFAGLFSEVNQDGA
ncbi:hypothetical protein D3C84_1155190 [compost metagenome]